MAKWCEICQTEEDWFCRRHHDMAVIKYPDGVAPPIGPKVWFANTIARLTNEDSVEQNVKYVAYNDHNDHMIRYRTEGLRKGYVSGFFIGILFSMAVFSIVKIIAGLVRH